MLLFTQFWIKAKITGQSKEITSSIEKNLDWGDVGADIDGSNVSSAILVGKVDPESGTCESWSIFSSPLSSLSGLDLGLLSLVLSSFLVGHLLEASTNIYNICD